MRHLAILCILLTCTLSIAVPRKPRCKAKPKVSANGSECMFFKLFMCDGGEWKALQQEEPYGSRKNPGYSCKAIKEDVAQATDGVYWIALNSREPFPVYCDMDNGGWTMVFKAVTGAAQRAFDIYNSADTFNEIVIDALDVTNKHPNDYKNRIVLNWGDFSPSEARVVLYKGGNSVQELIFDAKGSDKLNWFAFERLKNDPWSDIRTAYRNIFTTGGDHGRSFIINSAYHGCPGDVGWMVIVGSPCDWEKSKPPNAVLYSVMNVRTNWNYDGNVGIADVLVVYLR